MRGPYRVSLWPSPLFNGRYSVYLEACDVSFSAYLCFTMFDAHIVEPLTPCNTLPKKNLLMLVFFLFSDFSLGA